METNSAIQAVPEPGGMLRSRVARSLVWVLAFLYWFIGEGYLGLGTNALIMVIFALSLDLVLGYGGIISMGHAAFFGAGAYVAGNVALHLHPDPLVGLVLATLFCAVAGALTGALILHTEGVTLMMLTLAIGALFGEFANQAHWLTGGDDGLQLRVGPLLGLFKFDLWGRTAYLYCLAVALLWFVLAGWIVNSPFGKSVSGIRQNERRMKAIGTPVWWRLVAWYAIGAAMAGTAGALSAQVTQSVGLNSLGLLLSGTVLMVLILGGTRHRYGAFLGAVLYVVVQDLVAQADPFRWMFVIGAMLMAAVLFFDNGLLSIFGWLDRKLRRGGRSSR